MRYYSDYLNGRLARKLLQYEDETATSRFMTYHAAIKFPFQLLEYQKGQT
jgi:hypothetical protein